MRPRNLGYEVRPQVVPTGKKVCVTINPLLAYCRFDEDSDYVIERVSMEDAQSRVDDGGTIDYQFVGGALHITTVFSGEQEHMVNVYRVDGASRLLAGRFSVFSLESDLWVRRPYKGDLHIHSSYSDGRESPAYVAAASRQIGLDFTAITDHGLYFPSVEAQQPFLHWPTDFRIFRGEEIHPPQNPVHMINFGGEASVNELFARPRYHEEVQCLLESLPPMPPGVDRLVYASCVWCFEKIRVFGGLGIFCHPFWITNSHYNVATAFTDYMFAEQPFDAYELIGGYHLDEVYCNALQVAHYHEAGAKGWQVPIVGASDAHGCERDMLFGWYYTIVFSPSLALADLITSIKGFYSVAVEHLPGQDPRVYGPFRLVKLALFLLREYFPEHDAICADDGRLMLAHIRRDRKVVASRETVSAGSEDVRRRFALLERYWAGEPPTASEC